MSPAVSAAWMSIAASRPSATAVTVRSSPPVAQSPPAQTRGRPVRPGPVTAILPPSTASASGHRAEALADRGQHLVGRQPEGLRARRAVRVGCRRRSCRRGRGRHRGGVAEDAHAGAGREFLLVARSRPSGRGRGGRRSSPPRRRASWPARRRRSRSCRRRSPPRGGRPAARQVRRLPQLGDEVDRRAHLRAAARPPPSARTPPRPMPRKTASKSARSSSSVTSRPEALPRPQRDAADAEQPVDLGLGEAVHRLVGGDAELVEPAALGARRPSA